MNLHLCAGLQSILFTIMMKLTCCAPCVIQDNGYRYYTMEQFSIFFIISILKKAGTPLEEIKEYLSKRDNQTFIKVLNQKLAELNKEAEAIKKMCHILSSTIAEMERSMDIKIGEMQFIECNEEYLIITASPIRSGSSRQAMFSCFSQHFQYCEEHSIEVGWHIGEIVLQSDIANGCYKEGFYFSRLPIPIDDKRFLLSPKVLTLLCTIKEILIIWKSFIMKMSKN